MKIEINTDALGRDVSSLQNQYNALKRNLDSLNSSMTSLNSSWEGDAKSEYLRVYQQDYNTMKSLCNTLDQLIKTLMNAKNQYNSNNNRVKNVISQIRV